MKGFLYLRASASKSNSHSWHKQLKNNNHLSHLIQNSYSLLNVHSCNKNTCLYLTSLSAQLIRLSPLTPWMQMCHILTTLHALCHHISWHTSKSVTRTYPHWRSHSTNRKAWSALLSHRCKQQRQQVKFKSIPSSLSFTWFICRIL